MLTVQYNWGEKNMYRLYRTAESISTYLPGTATLYFYFARNSRCSKIQILNTLARNCVNIVTKINAFKDQEDHLPKCKYNTEPQKRMFPGLDKNSTFGYNLKDGWQME